jgi:hypothetical protein
MFTLNQGPVFVPKDFGYDRSRLGLVSQSQPRENPAGYNPYGGRSGANNCSDQYIQIAHSQSVLFVVLVTRLPG